MEQLRRILEIAGQRKHRITPCLQQNVYARAHRAKVARIEDRLDVPVGGADLTENAPRSVARRIVDEDVLAAVGGVLRHDVANRSVQPAHVLLLVVARGYHGEERLCGAGIRSFVHKRKMRR